MSDPFIAEIRIMPTNFAPIRWAFCNGQLLSISQNTALFSLLGTTYGGNGKTTFGLPNFQGSFPIQQGQGPGLSSYQLGEVGGSSTVTLSSSQIPAHTHTADAPTVNASSAAGNSTAPAGKVWAKLGREGAYSNAVANTQMAAGVSVAVNSAGGSQPHDNMPPYLALNFVMAMQGVYPLRP